MYRKENIIVGPKEESKDSLNYISARELKQTLGKDFCFTNGTSRPYLSEEECKKLISVLEEKYEG